jgi:hypothetical protein
MKKTILILFAVAIASVNLLAQETMRKEHSARTPEEKAENVSRKMTRELALNADQQAKIKALILKREQQREAKISNGKDNRDRMEAEIMGVLTPEQLQKWKQKKEEMKKSRPLENNKISEGDYAPTDPPETK